MNETSKINDSGAEESSVGTGRAKALQGRIFAGFLFLLLVGPMVLGVAWVLFSTPHPLTGPSTTRKNALSQQ